MPSDDSTQELRAARSASPAVLKPGDPAMSGLTKMSMLIKEMEGNHHMNVNLDEM